MELNLYAQLSEEALIGVVFFSTETFLEISSELDVNDFQSARCKTIFQAFHRLREEGEPLELPSLLNDLQKHGQLEAAGGEEFVSALAEKVSTIAGLGYHVKQVKEASATRRYVSLLEQGKADLEGGTPIGDALRGAKEAILKLERYGFVGQDPFESLAKTLEDKFNRDMAQEPDKLLGSDLTTFARLAHDIKGIQPGFYIVAADTNTGKTSFLCNLTLDLLASNQDLTGIFFSLDDSGCDSQPPPSHSRRNPHKPSAM